MTSVWDRVIGQEAAVKRLRLLAERPTHAYLFVGPEGAGKETAARAFAARLVTGSDDAPVLQSVTALSSIVYVTSLVRPVIVIGLVRLGGESAVHTPLLSSQYS